MNEKSLQPRRLEVTRLFNSISGYITRKAGSPAASLLSFVVVIAWAISGPFFDYSEMWQLVINTGTTIITFLMVFIIQHSQNRDTAAIHLKLNELIASHDKASNRLVDSEDLTGEELELLKKFYVRLSRRVKNEHGKSLYSTHSLDEKESNAQERRPPKERKNQRSGK